MKLHGILLLLTTLAYHSPSVIMFSPLQLEPHAATLSDSALNHPVHSQPSAGTSQASAAAGVLQPDRCIACSNKLNLTLLE